MSESLSCISMLRYRELKSPISSLPHIRLMGLAPMGLCVGRLVAAFITDDMSASWLRKTVKRAQLRLRLRPITKQVVRWSYTFYTESCNHFFHSSRDPALTNLWFKRLIKSSGWSHVTNSPSHGTNLFVPFDGICFLKITTNTVVNHRPLRQNRFRVELIITQLLCYSTSHKLVKHSDKSW